MSKPIISKITSYDATNAYTITMTYVGNLAYKNRVTIYDATTLELVYDKTVSTTSLTQTIPASTLINGTKYYVQALVYEKDGTSSSWSDKTYFYCYSTPSFYFSNVTDGMTVTAASLYAKLIYSQLQNEEIASFQFYIYDSGKTLLSTSDMFHSTLDLTYGFKGLENDTFYYIRAKGSTRHEIQMDTGYIKIYVLYSNHSEYNMVFADCDEATSVVTYHTRFIFVYPSTTETYTYDEGIIDLVDKSLIYNQNINLSGDFTITLRAMNLRHSGVIMTCSNGTYTMTLSSFIYDDGTIRFKLLVPNGLTNYVLYSEATQLSDAQMVTLHVRRINNVYQLKVIVSDYIFSANYWFGKSDPADIKELSMYDIWIDEETDTTEIEKDDINVAYQNDEPDTSSAVDYGVVWIGGKS